MTKCCTCGNPISPDQTSAYCVPVCKSPDFALFTINAENVMRSVYDDREDTPPKALVGQFLVDDDEIVWLVCEPIWEEDVIEEDGIDASCWACGETLASFATEKEARTYVSAMK